MALDRADVCFSEQRNPRIAEREVCEITLFGQGRVLRAQAAATDVEVAAARVVGQLQQRAERFRGRLAGRNRPRRYVPVTGANSGHARSVHFGTNWSTAGSDLGAVDHGVEIAAEVADRRFSDPTTEPLTPEEAALEMGERGFDIFFFLNAETGQVAVVYRRRDGEIAMAAI